MQTCRLAYSVTVPLLTFLGTWAIVHGNDDPHPADFDIKVKQIWDELVAGHDCWCNASSGLLPSGSVQGGRDDEPLYVGRAWHKYALIPGNVKPSHSVCYVASDGKTYGKTDYQVLCGCNPGWVAMSGGDFPPNVMTGGRSKDGETLFVGRVNHEGTLTIGKVSSSQNVLYIPFNGTEVAFSKYEILVSEYVSFVR